MRNVMVTGAGMTRFGKFPDRGVRSLTEEATREALKDANAPAGEVEMVFFANAVAGLITGLLGVPIVNVENACASASTAFNLAYLAIASGQAEVALAVGAEKMTHEDKQRAFKAIGTAVDLEQMQELEAQMAADRARPDSGSPATLVADAPPGSSRSFFMDIYAGMSRKYMEKSGATARDFAEIAVKNHHHGALNPKAQYRNEVTVEEVLESREVSNPLTLLMCSPVGDGAAALVLCSEEYAKRVGAETVRVLTSVLLSGQDDGEEPATVRTAKRAYEMAGVGPED